MKNVAVVGAPEDDGVVEESGGRRDAAVCVHGKGNCRLIFFFENFTFIPRLYFFNIFPKNVYLKKNQNLFLLIFL